MADSPEAIKKHVKAYLIVGYILFFCTFLTVAVAKWEFLDVGAYGLSPGDIFIGLCIAGFKASLVALIFMHLNAEKSLIYKFLMFTAFFFFGLMFLSLFELWNPVASVFDIHGLGNDSGN